MKAYTFVELNALHEARSYITKDRFDHYFSTMFGYDDKQLKKAYQLFQKFPMAIREEREAVKLDLVLSQVLTVSKIFTDSWYIRASQTIAAPQNLFEKIIYKEGNETKEVVFDLHLSADVIAYAELLKRAGENSIITICAYWDNIQKGQHPNIVERKIFVGDMYVVCDSYWGEGIGSLYIAYANNEGGFAFVPLMYIKGKGYMLNGQPNLGTERYSRHKVQKDEWRYLGNIATHEHLLEEPEKLNSPTLNPEA